MDRSGDLLTTLRALARQLDDTALASLANKGLVRRARKDLEKAAPEIGGVQGDALSLMVDGQRVALRSPPTASTCSCPASGVCRHQLAAWIHLAGDESGETADQLVEEDPVPALLALDDAVLLRFAGRPLLRRALSELAAGCEVVADSGHPGHVRIPSFGIELRFFGGDDPLAASTCSCHEAPVCLHRLVAVCGLQVAHARRVLDVASEGGPAASAQAPRDRGDVLRAVRALLLDLLATGLSRVSPALLARLSTLSTSAHGVDLPRLERELRGLGGSLQALRDRTGVADARDAAVRAARLAALVEGLERGVPGLVGRHRARFVRVGELELLGVGAEAFTTRGGHRGLTCWFWDPEAQRWNSWTDARPPSGQRGFEPAARFVGPGPWEGCASPRAASRSRVRLLGGWRSADGRLSARAGVRAVLDESWSLRQVPRIRDWREVGGRASRLFGGGLAEVENDAAMVLVEPAEVGETTFDAVGQCWRTVLTDESGSELVAVLEHEDLGDDAGRAFARVARGDWLPTLARLVLRDGEVMLAPVTLLGGAAPFSPTLGGAAQGLAAASGSSDDSEDESGVIPDHGDAAPVVGDVVGGLLDRLLGELVEHCERGARTTSRVGTGRLTSELVDGGGWAALRAPAEALADAGDAWRRADALCRMVHVVDRALRAWLLRPIG